MSKQFDLIIFDWDGTLMDSIGWIVHCMQTAAKNAELSVPDTAEVKNVIGLSLQKAITQLFPAIDTVTKKNLVHHYEQAFFSREMTPNDLFTGIDAMLLNLKKQGYQLAVATGKRRDGLQKAMLATGVVELFDYTRCADEAGSKPDPAMIKDIIGYLGADYSRTVMVGDSSHDLQMANNANISAIAVECGAHSRVKLQQYNPMLCVQQTTELSEIFGG